MVSMAGPSWDAGGRRRVAVGRTRRGRGAAVLVAAPCVPRAVVGDDLAKEAPTPKRPEHERDDDRRHERPGPRGQLRLVRPDRRCHSTTTDPRSSTPPSAPTARSTERRSPSPPPVSMPPWGAVGVFAPVTTPQLAGSVASSGTSGIAEVLGERGDSGSADVVSPVAVHVDAVLDDVDLGELVDQPLRQLVGGEGPVVVDVSRCCRRRASGRWPGRCRPRRRPRSSAP